MPFVGPRVQLCSGARGDWASVLGGRNSDACRTRGGARAPGGATRRGRVRSCRRVVLEGMAGIGKSSLWRESVESARRRGYEVLETAPSEPDAVLAFSGLGDLFERDSGSASSIRSPRVQAQALRAALYLTEVPERSAAIWRLCPARSSACCASSSGAGPVLIAIDDEQWLDPASARVLALRAGPAARRANRSV